MEKKIAKSSKAILSMQLLKRMPKPSAQLLIKWLGTSIAIFGAALLADHFVFGDTGWGTYKQPICQGNPGSSCPLYVKPLILGIRPFVGTALIIIGPMLIVYGKLARASDISEKQPH